jgi:hypothetical protein
VELEIVSLPFSISRRKFMKKLIACAVLSTVVFISGCNSPDPTEPPVNNTKPPVGIPGPSKAVPSEPTQEPEQPSNPEPAPNPQPEPKPSPTSSSATTPAVEFAKRWGKRYPEVPEYLILKTANGVCRAIETAGNGWENNPLVLAGINTATDAVGLGSNIGLEFALDANQNYCSSMSNPT